MCQRQALPRSKHTGFSLPEPAELRSRAWGQRGPCGWSLCTDRCGNSSIRRAGRVERLTDQCPCTTPCQWLASCTPAPSPPSRCSEAGPVPAGFRPPLPVWIRRGQEAGDLPSQGSKAVHLLRAPGAPAWGGQPGGGAGWNGLKPRGRASAGCAGGADGALQRRRSVRMRTVLSFCRDHGLPSGAVPGAGACDRAHRLPRSR